MLSISLAKARANTGHVVLAHGLAGRGLDLNAHRFLFADPFVKALLTPVQGVNLQPEESGLG